MKESFKKANSKINFTISVFCKLFVFAHFAGHSAKETIHTETQRFLKYGFNGSGIAASIRAASSSTGTFSPFRNQSLIASDKARM